MKIAEFDSEKRFFYENGYYLTSDKTRIPKLLAHYELYKMVLDLPGHIVECGVFKGASFMQWVTFREAFEHPFSRKVIGFDIFGPFPETEFEADESKRQFFIDETGGGVGLSVDEIEASLKFKGISNCELIKGDITRTVPDYMKAHPELKISLLHIDTDIYEPAVTILENMYNSIVRGGILVLDDYGIFPGETKAVDDFFADKDVVINKLPFSHQIPAYIVKK
ncbi:TylF/MycF/NovP-related O-methyltransferase [Maridesulfovibrio hydrothermalis]|uniref:dTDP-6-deoxy-L-hexose 3-O-methyltransferase n=1 Tax=Maridesulfovibrio hydrothermalis AM13 = DSM 14728 TaxID=1121451 RepID=L0RBR7_9BACT|nr:TylF/MycF/NovP-related O-methyltransferase [Maridesulfovibrio hydrothermalis]CCO24233.1 conserved protein of unknown function [Maridesulfovibrio hydrothermalis AM13 = DSM 14728]